MSVTRYDVKGGYVEIPDSPTITTPPTNPGGSFPSDFNPLPGGWYANAQGAEIRWDTAQNATLIPASGNLIFARLAIPAGGDRRIGVLSDFTCEVENPANASGPLQVLAQIGVSNPSEFEYPIRPYVGVMHSVSRARILPGALVPLHVIRLDVINPSLLTTDIPWSVNLGADGRTPPLLAPQVFGPAGTRVFNCAARAVLIG